MMEKAGGAEKAAPVEKVVAYVLRKGSSGMEILVFTQPEKPEAGFEVPAGTVLEGEDPVAAAKRELWEEAGLSEFRGPARICDKTVFDTGLQVDVRRTYFAFLLAERTEETWEQWVGGEGDDAGDVYVYSWMPLDQAGARLSRGLGEAISMIGFGRPPG